MAKNLAIILCALGLSAVFADKSCEKNSDCESGQCCVENHWFMVASKRDLRPNQNGILPFDMEGGTCVNYIKEGGNCHHMEPAECGCEPGTKCNYYPEDLKLEKPELVVGKRAMMFLPGKSICETSDKLT